MEILIINTYEKNKLFPIVRVKTNEQTFSTEES